MQTTDRIAHGRLGLALSGGGFRASLYHLGVVRCLRDAGILPRVSRITSVSGGSVLAAHLALNWERYCGSEESFQAAADELVRLVRVDVRNRIVRRFPLMAGWNLVRRLSFLGASRAYTRTGLLEGHYREFLYGDRGLLELPDSPRLYILATNLSHGSLCAFSRDGMLLQRRNADGSLELDTVHTGLATVSMAVAASSAFPGFFPPLELSHLDLGASEAEFDRQAFTDGGIYDNLGLRMFRVLDSLQRTTTGPEGPTERPGDPADLGGLIVSDAGATFQVTSGGASGLLGTAIRSSDILMDRVNQLELELFAETGGALFFPITRVVLPHEDPTALHPELQRQAARIRTDLDRFSDLEVTTLVEHGYAVARQCLRETPDADSVELPEGPPWKPFGGSDAKGGASSAAPADPSAALPAARKLQRSSARRILTTLFSAGDWPSYFWLALILLLLLGGPYLVYDARITAARQEQVLSAVAQSSPLYADVLERLQRSGPVPIEALRFVEVASVEPPDFTGYEVISDDRIYDLRGWTSSDAPRHPARMRARFQIVRTEEAASRPVLRIQLPSEAETMNAEYWPASLNPTHVRALSDGLFTFETRLDFGHVPIGTETTLVVRQDMPTFMARQEFGVGEFRFTVAAKTGLVRLWVLLPAGRAHGQFELYRSPIGQPETTEMVHATDTVEVPRGYIATFQMVDPPEGFRYEVRWTWTDEAGS